MRALRNSGTLLLCILYLSGSAGIDDSLRAKVRMKNGTHVLCVLRGFYPSYTESLPPASITTDRGAVGPYIFRYESRFIDHLSLGGMFGYYRLDWTTHEKVPVGNNYRFVDTGYSYHAYRVGLRPTLHFTGLSSDLDIYVGGTAGMSFAGLLKEGQQVPRSDVHGVAYNRFFAGGSVGIRYFFLPMVGISGEAGWEMSSHFFAGVVLRI